MYGNIAEADSERKNIVGKQIKKKSPPSLKLWRAKSGRQDSKLVIKYY